MATVRMEKVTKVFSGGEVAVEDVDLVAGDGEFLVIVGPSGSGKSTLLRLLAGLETVSRGRIFLDETEVTGIPPRERDVAMVFQNYALYPHKTVRENLAFGLRMRGADEARIEERVDEVARMLEIGELLDRKPAALSGGQQQRVALGRAIARAPRAFLLDEPLSNLDPRLRLRTRTELARLQRSLEATVLYVTHDQEEAMTLGHRVAVLRRGRIQQVAPPEELYRKPANRFVARFIGSPSMNLFRCRAPDGGESPLLEGPGFTLKGLPPPLRRSLEAEDLRDGEVELGVRPLDVEVVGEDDADASGTVELMESLGSEDRLHVGLRDAEEETLVAVVPGGTEISVDDPVHLRFRRDRLHLFRTEEGTRIEEAGSTD